MQPAPTRSSLFTRLLPGRRGSSNNEGSAEGHEEYLTQIVGWVLQEDPALTRRLLNRWLQNQMSLGPSDTPVVATEVAVDAHTDGNEGVRIDLVIHLPKHLIFIENKVGAALNRYSSVISGTQIVEDQVERYHRVLAKERGNRVGHLIVLSQGPVADHSTLRSEFYRGSHRWWDLYKVVEQHLSVSEVAPGARHVEELFLAFLREMHLDPPRLLVQDGFDARSGLKLLGLAAERVAGLSNPRVPAGSQSLLFETKQDSDGADTRGRSWTVSFAPSQSGVELRVSLVGEGARVVPELGRHFWEAPSPESQAEWLGGLLGQVSSLEPAERARRPFADALSRFKNREIAGLVAESLVSALGRAPRVGTMASQVAELTFDQVNSRNWTVRLAPYSDERLIVSCGARALPGVRDAISAILHRKFVSRPTNQLNIPLTGMTEDEALSIIAYLLGAQDRT